MAVTKFNKTLVCHVAGFLFLEETAANLVLIYPGYHPVGQKLIQKMVPMVPNTVHQKSLFRTVRYKRIQQKP